MDSLGCFWERKLSAQAFLMSIVYSDTITFRLSAVCDSVCHSSKGRGATLGICQSVTWILGLLFTFLACYGGAIQVIEEQGIFWRPKPSF